MTLLKILLVIICISLAAGIIAFVKELLAKPKRKTNGPYERFIKRPLDAFLATGALIVLSPVFIILSIIVRIQLGSPILFKQLRPGRDCEVFQLYKFRSMLDKNDENGNPLPDDERLTKFGRILRSTSLDELPELLNIIKGDMAIVGPRPLLLEYIPFYTEEELHRHDVRPGLTGWAQVNGRNSISTWEERFAYDLEYANNITFAMDLKIILITVIKVLRRSDIRIGQQLLIGRLDVVRSEGNDKEV